MSVSKMFGMISRKIVGFIFGVAVTLCLAIPAYAQMSTEEAALVLASASDGFLSVDSGGALKTEATADNFWHRMRQIVVDVFPGCSIYDIDSVYGIADADDPEKMVYTIPEEAIQTWISYQEIVDDWLDEHMRGIVPDGMTREEAIDTAFHFLADYAHYDHSIMQNNLARENQSAHNVFTTQRAICASYSSAFRVMIEYIPFTDEGIVDWERGTSRIPAALVMYFGKDGKAGHEWAAIQDPDDSWYHYDLAFYAAGGSDQTCYHVDTARQYAHHTKAAQGEFLWLY